MGIHVNQRATIIIAWGIVITITALNVFLLYQFFMS